MIAKKYLIPRQCFEDSGLGNKNLTFTDEAVLAVIQPIHARKRRAPVGATDRRGRAQSGAQARERRRVPMIATTRRSTTRKYVSSSVGYARSSGSMPPKRMRLVSQPACITRRRAATSCSSKRRSGAPPGRAASG